MSATAAKYIDTTNSISEDDEVYLFHAARQNGRRNALPDLGTQLTQGKFVYLFSIRFTRIVFVSAETTAGNCDVDKITPHIQSMSVKP